MRTAAKPREGTIELPELLAAAEPILGEVLDEAVLLLLLPLLLLLLLLLLAEVPFNVLVHWIFSK